MASLYNSYKNAKRKKLVYGGSWDELGQGNGIQLNKPANSEYAYAPAGGYKSPEQIHAGSYATNTTADKPAGVSGDTISAGVTGAFSLAQAFMTDKRPRGYYEKSGGEKRTNEGLKYGAQGASLGATVGGPIGAVVGGAVGMLGGYFAGAKKEKAHNAEVDKRQSLFQESERLEMQGQHTDPNYSTGNRHNQMYKHGGSLKRDPSYDAMSEVLTQRNKSLPWVNRALDGNSEYIPDSEGSRQTHRLSTGDDGKGNYYVYPEITQRDGKLFDGTQDRAAAHKYAIDNKLTMSMPSRKMAEYYSQQGLIKHQYGGSLGEQFAKSKDMTKLSNNSVEVHGRSHAQGGVDVPGTNSEVERGETIADDYVFSKELGFADLHKPIAKAKGKIEEKPATRERVNSLRLLMEREEKLKKQQELMKQQLNLV